MTKLYYLASPYTHESASVMNDRANVSSIVSRQLMLEGIAHYAPISSEHHLRKFGDMPHTWTAWRNIDLAFVSRVDGILVLCIDGFRESTGVQAEIRYARKNKTRVEFLVPRLSGTTLEYDRLDTSRGIIATCSNVFMYRYDRNKFNSD